MIIRQIKIFIARHELSIWIVFLLGVFAAFMVVVPKVISHYELDSEENTVLFSTVLGAIIGAFCTFIGSLVVNWFAEKRTREIKNRERIYIPLYDEIKNIHCKILVDNPYPKEISFAKDSQTVTMHPQYVVWDEIKNDSRYFDVPKSITCKINDLYFALEEYKTCLQEVIFDYNKIYICKFSGESVSSADIQSGFGSILLTKVLECNLKGEETFHIGKISFSCAELINKASYERYMKSYNEWLKKEDTVLEELKYYIRLVS